MSHFPSIEEFDEGVVAPAAGTFDNADDFLAHEQAILGSDADQFAASADRFPALDNEADLLGGDEETHKFESSFPDLIGDNEAVGPGGTITGTGAPYMPGVVNTNFPSSTLPDEEPDVIKQWRERQQLEIQRRDELSETRKQETVDKARAAIDDFYDNYNSKKDKSIEQTRKEAEEFLANRENTSAGGTSWERIAKLVDLTDKGVRSGNSDKTRFRELLVSLRKDEKAPGASGI
ncbi:hypothetical protein H072_7904 [Dactylellina haptotyla CBS 200.50]|uniref:Clathrin light chain n=1 Tax=Dactylellina haptotyla (strain CBS 200.50) TaxID=1284197 RepID=S8BSM5_DACHA|nr:hypothetical protein H072_7904 [Dactylellina haptotyla CBS 200.50]